MNKTTLFAEHEKLGAKMVDFGGWSMPINYGSQINEHKIVRSDVGIFDVSHMSIFDLDGSEQEKFLKYLLPNDVSKIKNSGRALYSPLLNKDGGVLDDLIVYNLGTHYRIISNCATRALNHDWFVRQCESYDVNIRFMSNFSIIAIQGPQSLNLLKKIGINDLHDMYEAADSLVFESAAYTVRSLVPDWDKEDYYMKAWEFPDNSSSEYIKLMAILQKFIDQGMSVNQWYDLTKIEGKIPVSYTHLTLPTTPYV